MTLYMEKKDFEGFREFFQEILDTEEAEIDRWIDMAIDAAEAGLVLLDELEEYVK